jgi:hypothetical protein
VTQRAQVWKKSNLAGVAVDARIAEAGTTVDTSAGGSAINKRQVYHAYLVLRTPERDLRLEVQADARSHRTALERPVMCRCLACSASPACRSAR